MEGFLDRATAEEKSWGLVHTSVIKGDLVRWASPALTLIIKEDLEERSREAGIFYPNLGRRLTSCPASFML